MRFGLIADTHGNLAGLEAALAALKKEQVDVVVHLGDLLHDGKDVQEVRCYRLLLENDVIQLRGHREQEVFKMRDLPLSEDERRSIAELCTAVGWGFEIYATHCSVTGVVEPSAARIRTEEQFRAEVGKMGTGMRPPEWPKFNHIYFLGHSHRRAIAHAGSDSITFEEPHLHEEYLLDAGLRHLVLVGNIGLLEAGCQPSFAVYDMTRMLLRFEEC